jgi:tRNA-2-methylthio-N6-dimethylallyladenosine synthase
MIMEGCDKVCSYCVVPYTRGPEVSRPPEQVIGEVQKLAGQGFREVMLLGQNVNSYGRRMSGEPLVLRSFDLAQDQHERTGAQGERRRMAFPDLLAQVNEVPGIERVRFITSHPWDAVEELFDAMRDLPHVCEHLHLPVQSGSDGVLERMRRGYTAEEYLNKLELLRARVPEVAVSTDLIVGFPGETEEDFEATLRLVKAARFDSAFIFSYSPRPFAAASRWEDDVPAEVKNRRLQALLALQERISKEEGERRIGETVEILVEEPGMGRTRTNRKAYFEANGEKAGELVNIRVNGIRGHSFMGERV